MTVVAAKLANRDIYGVTYDGASGEGIIEAVLENAENGDKSAYVGKNDGEFVVTVATGWSGVDHVTITDAGGHVIDEGDITFGDPEESVQPVDEAAE